MIIKLIYYSIENIEYRMCCVFQGAPPAGQGEDRHVSGVYHCGQHPGDHGQGQELHLRLCVRYADPTRNHLQRLCPHSH